METMKKVIVRPGISTGEMKRIWETTIREAEDEPGTLHTIVFMPGDYPLPEDGIYVYKNVPTTLHAAPPGAEVTFRYVASSGEMEIRTRRKRGGERLCAGSSRQP